MQNINGTFQIPPEATGTTNTTDITQVEAIVYQMIREAEQPMEKPKKKDTVKGFYKILKKSKKKQRRKIIKKLLPLMEADIKKSKGKGSRKSKKGKKSKLRHTLIRDSASTALRLTERYIESKFPSKDQASK